MLSLEHRLQAGVHQGHLEYILNKLFPSENILSNVRKGGSIRSPITGKLIELDIWVPSKNISFEFQDEYHYTSTWESQLPLPFVQQKDALKLSVTRSKGNTLIIVPCWWDGLPESLLASIWFSRPDIFPNQMGSTPIPLNAPSSYFARRGIPEVEELMLASFPVDVDIYSAISPLSSWWLGEKYDGIRFCWHPVRKTLYSRSGLAFSQLSRLSNLFPDIFLDGELWFGRGCFYDTQRVLISSFSPVSWSEWCDMRSLVFDTPSPKTYILAYEDRYRMLLDGIPHNHPFISNALRVMCFSKTYLTETANSIVKDGGEGVILRKPGSRYEKGRSDNLFKFKAARSDREALVLRSTPNQYFVLQLTDGRTIRAQCKTFPKGKGPKRGDVVTFEYDSVSRVGVPVNPVISRVRRDVEWQDIVKKGGEAQSNLNAPSSKAMGLESRYAYHWPLEKLKGRRLFFEKFALARGFDPLVAKNWYRISRKAVENTEGGSAVLSHYNGSVIKALLSLFPGIGLEKTKFSILPKKYWLPIENRRKFFLDFAKQKKFDPFVASNWYSVKMSTFLKSKGGFSVLEFHNGSLITALSHLFPEIKFSESDPKTAKFDELEKRDFFLSFAKNKKFDSLVPDNWYIHAGEIPSIKGARVIIHEYGGDVVRALLRLFPSMGLEKDKLYSAYGNYWRKRLHEFSLDNSFDPLIPDNWYHMTREKELTIFNQDTKELLKFPRDLVIKEILNHFPYIGLEKSKFAYLSDKYNLNDNARKKFFERVAKLKGFDPNIAENWYSVTRWDVMQVKGASAVLRYYNGSYIKALTALFPDLSLKPLKFPSLSRNHWRDPSRRRAFLDAFAKKHNFDALQWNEWEKVSIRDICSEKGGSSVLKRYNFSLIQTLKDLYPDMKPSADYLVTGAGGRRKKVRNKG